MELVELHPRFLASLRSGDPHETGALLERCAALAPGLAPYYAKMRARLPS
jgi:hypothetical protein